MCVNKNAKVNTNQKINSDKVRLQILALIHLRLDL